MTITKKPPTSPTPVQGVELVIGYVEYVVPALSLFDVRRLAPQLKTMDLTSRVNPENLLVLVDVAHSALKRNYPEITSEELEKQLDLGNMSRVFEAVMGVSGFEPAKEGSESGESTGRS